MICDGCGKNPATVHLVRIRNGEKREEHLCQSCAQERGELDLFGEPGLLEPKFSLQNLLAGLLHSEAALAPHLPVTYQERCGLCGLTYEEFTRSGRLGCSRCYQDLGARLDPVIRRIHGSATHTGRVPRKAGARARSLREADRLRRDLEECIRREDFERAAEIRDRLRELEREPGRGEGRDG